MTRVEKLIEETEHRHVLLLQEADRLIAEANALEEQLQDLKRYVEFTKEP